MHAAEMLIAGSGALVGRLQRYVLPAVGLIEGDGLDLLQVGVAGAGPHHNLVGRVALVQLVVQPDCYRRQSHLQHTNDEVRMTIPWAKGFRLCFVSALSPIPASLMCKKQPAVHLIHMSSSAIHLSSH